MKTLLDESKDLLSPKTVKTTEICDSSLGEKRKDTWEKALQQFCKILHGLVDKEQHCMQRFGDKHKYWTLYHLWSDCVANTDFCV